MRTARRVCDWTRSPDWQPVCSVRGTILTEPRSSCCARLLVHADRSVQVEALRALRRSLKLSYVRADVTALAVGLNQQVGTTDDRQELAEQLASAFRTAELPLPRAADQRAAQRPPATDINAWVQMGSTGGDAAEGRRVFEHPNGPGCFRCHTVNGRGGKIGPDLSVVARSLNREKLAESILRPSKEIAPQFTAWTFVTRQGQTFVGLVIAEDRNGSLRIGTPEGDVREMKAEDLEESPPAVDVDHARTTGRLDDDRRIPRSDRILGNAEITGSTSRWEFRAPPVPSLQTARKRPILYGFVPTRNDKQTIVDR